MTTRKRQKPGKRLCEWNRLSLRTLAVAVTFCCLLTLCTGCAPVPVRQVKIVRESPPTVLMQDCQHPQIAEALTIKQALLLLYDYQGALNRCNQDKTALRLFYSEGSK